MGVTALHFAMRQPDVVELLLDRGANIRTTDHVPNTHLLTLNICCKCANSLLKYL
jgi:ankyrin repeat protein